MASTKDYLDYVLEQLGDVQELSHRSMMGEYILYVEGKVFGGIYDNRLLIKPTKSAREMLPDAPMELPYEGAKEMLLVEELDDRALLTQVVTAMADELPMPKKKRK
ncbi:TfoX/Sxy family protein [uncultured Ruminococcus sp.]|uniref:TfoX/Sxy family protein n=1 Tax=uncultured Ruminococcus sp. TaxID=165186 RepID=UPI002931ABD7|nr:TfoX/Sxy family protein [uncultured Ruminococcus sp.]